MTPNILIIEDEPTLADVLADNLRAEGYAVLHAPDGQSGKKLWQDEAPNLIVLDVMLPHINGFDLCQQMREAGDTTPVFFSKRQRTSERARDGLVGGWRRLLTQTLSPARIFAAGAKLTKAAGLGAGEKRRDLFVWGAQGGLSCLDGDAL